MLSEFTIFYIPMFYNLSFSDKLTKWFDSGITYTHKWNEEIKWTHVQLNSNSKKLQTTNISIENVQCTTYYRYMIYIFVYA